MLRFLRPRAATALTLLLLAGCGRPASDQPSDSPGPGRSSAPEAPPAAKGDGDGEREAGGPPRFVARREVSVGGAPTGLVAADLDGDGALDLAAVLERPGGLLLWPARAGGVAAPPLRIEGGSWALGPIAHPSSEPGRPPSLVVASRAPAELRITKLGPSLEPGTQRFAVEGTPRALASGALAPQAAAELWLAFGDDRLLRFGPERGAREVGIDPGRATCLLPTEAGALWVGSQEPRVLRRYRAADLGGERATASLEVPLAGIPRALLESDVDGDGDRELVCFGGDEDLWVWGLGSEAEPGSEPPRRYRAPGVVPLAAVSVDLDGDGREELVSVHAYDTSYGVLGRFDLERDAFGLRASEYAGQTPVDLAVVDLDGDGRNDLAIANRDAGRVSVLPGTGLAAPGKAVFYEARRTPVGTNPLGVALGDLDGDGALDAVSANGSAGTCTVLFNRFTLLEERRDLPLGPSPTAVRVVDVDADGTLDVVALLRPGGSARLALLRGLGGGEFAAPELLELAGDGARLETIDLYGDGSPDLVVCDPLGARVLVVALPLPAGAALPSPRVLSVGPRPTAVEGLASPDGRRLLAVAHGAPSAAISIHAVEAGTAVELRRAPVDGAPVDLASGDFDGDGRDELACLARTAPGDPQGFVQLWLSTEAGVVPGERAAVGLLAGEIVAGDLDGDGADDLAVASQNTHNVDVLLNGAVRLRRQPDLGAGLGCIALALGDLTGNGRLDLVVANAFSHDLSTIYNP